MSCIFTYKSEKITCPYPSCWKQIEGVVVHQESPITKLRCPHCGKEFMVEIAAYKTTTLDFPQ